jgi:S-adenosylmethionine hydrolase
LIITLLTDFGLSGPYVGSMKGIILGINPDVKIIDISHRISPQNIEEAAFVLNQVYKYFPESTIHVIVVDPGVGSKRAVLAVKTNVYTFIAPDNGVLKYIYHNHPDAIVYEITNKMYFRQSVSHTFHGRDIFAPVAAHLSIGIEIANMGSKCSPVVKAEIRKPLVINQKISGEIIFFDHFGNGITNIDSSLLKSNYIKRITVGNRSINKLSQSYSDMPANELLALIGSHETLEISINRGNAEKKLDLNIGDPVNIETGETING